jgi:hypothetical protein
MTYKTNRADFEAYKILEETKENITNDHKEIGCEGVDWI